MKRFIIRILIQQRPADIVTLAFLAFLFLITAIFYKTLPRATYLLSLYSALFFIQILAIKVRNRGRLTVLFHDIIFPVTCVLAIFDSLEWVVHYINPDDIDLLLIRLDYMIFGCHPTVMLEKIMTPLLTDVLQLAYTSYYFIPLSFGILLMKNNQKEEFNRTLFLILFCFYLSYLGYILFPALGPRFYLNHLQTTELQGFIVAGPIQNLLNTLEGTKRDAFPSGHTAITVTVLVLSYRYSRKFFRICLPIVFALILSTVYCRYHYVVDVLAGFLLTIITIVVGERYYEWWQKKRQFAQKTL